MIKNFVKMKGLQNTIVKELNKGRVLKFNFDPTYAIQINTRMQVLITHTRDGYWTVKKL